MVVKLNTKRIDIDFEDAQAVQGFLINLYNDLQNLVDKINELEAEIDDHESRITALETP